jgi:hypothetical protein
MLSGRVKSGRPEFNSGPRSVRSCNLAYHTCNLAHHMRRLTVPNESASRDQRSIWAAAGHAEPMSATSRRRSGLARAYAPWLFRLAACDTRRRQSLSRHHARGFVPVTNLVSD